MILNLLDSNQFIRLSEARKLALQIGADTEQRLEKERAAESRFLQGLDSEEDN